MAGMLLLWLAIELAVLYLEYKHFGLLDDNSPTVSWVDKMTSKNLKTAAALLCILSMRLKRAHALPLIPMHIPGEKNIITDIPSPSFGRKLKWHCTTDEEFLTLFDSKFPLPQQNSWTLCHLSKEICSKVISVLVTQRSTPEEWRWLTSKKTSTGRKINPNTNPNSQHSQNLLAE